METKLYNQEAKEIWTIDLNEIVFGQEINENLIHRALTYQLANNRQVLAHTKTRWERRGSTRKIYRQKWTGRARMWSNRSPIRKKGWVVFGPRNDVNFSISMNKKERRKALFSLLSSRVNSGDFKVIDNISFWEIKTKNMFDLINKFEIKDKTLFVLPSSSKEIEKSTSNLANAKTLLVNYINISDLLKYKNIVLLKESLPKIDEIYVK